MSIELPCNILPCCRGGVISKVAVNIGSTIENWGEPERARPHTSGTALRTCVCMFACLLAALAAIYRKFLNERI